LKQVTKNEKKNIKSKKIIKKKGGLKTTPNCQPFMAG
jgi:hypothetical protein